MNWGKCLSSVKSDLSLSTIFTKIGDQKSVSVALIRLFHVNNKLVGENWTNTRMLVYGLSYAADRSDVVKGRSSSVWLADKLCHSESFLSY